MKTPSIDIPRDTHYTQTHEDSLSQETTPPAAFFSPTLWGSTPPNSAPLSSSHPTGNPSALLGRATTIEQKIAEIKDLIENWDEVEKTARSSKDENWYPNTVQNWYSQYLNLNDEEIRSITKGHFTRNEDIFESIKLLFDSTLAKQHLCCILAILNLQFSGNDHSSGVNRTIYDAVYNIYGQKQISKSMAQLRQLFNDFKASLHRSC